ELDAASLQVLRAASIGALALDPELIAALTGLAPERIEQLLAVLEQHGLLGFDGERYRFAAPLIAEVVRGERLLPGERRALRARRCLTATQAAPVPHRGRQLMMVTQKSTSAELFEKFASGVHCRELAVAVIRYCPSCRWAVQCTRYSSPGPSAGTQTCPSPSGSAQGERNDNGPVWINDTGAQPLKLRIELPAGVRPRLLTTAVSWTSGPHTTPYIGSTCGVTLFTIRSAWAAPWTTVYETLLLSLKCLDPGSATVALAT